jgi:hypothetical protein
MKNAENGLCNGEISLTHREMDCKRIRNRDAVTNVRGIRRKHFREIKSTQ